MNKKWQLLIIIPICSFLIYSPIKSLTSHLAVDKIIRGCLFTDSEEFCAKFNNLIGIPFEDWGEI